MPKTRNQASGRPQWPGPPALELDTFRYRGKTWDAPNSIVPERTLGYRGTMVEVWNFEITHLVFDSIISTVIQWNHNTRPSSAVPRAGRSPERSTSCLVKKVHLLGLFRSLSAESVASYRILSQYTVKCAACQCVFPTGRVSLFAANRQRHECCLTNCPRHNKHLHLCRQRRHIPWALQVQVSAAASVAVSVHTGTVPCDRRNCVPISVYPVIRLHQHCAAGASVRCSIRWPVSPTRYPPSPSPSHASCP